LKILFLLLTTSIILPVSLAAAELAQLTQQCDSCHGSEGVSTEDDIPIIAGKSGGLMKKALEQFQVMDRPCKRTAYRHGETDRSQTSMCNVAGQLDSEDINLLSQYYAGLAFLPATQEFDEAKAINGASLHSLYCESCHPSIGGEPGYASRLAGQWRPYLERTIGQIRTGELLVPHMMERKLTGFSEPEIEDLLNFWASRQD
jgi:sulfide dehydrogenase cytochrome subunit